MTVKLFVVFVFVVSCAAAIHFAVESWRVFRSPEFKADLERLREQRRRRIAARREV